LTSAISNTPDPTSLVLEQIVPSLVSALNTNQAQLVDLIQGQTSVFAEELRRQLHDVHSSLHRLSTAELSVRILPGPPQSFDTTEASHGEESGGMFSF
jgi:hypothetical protein